MKVAIIGGSGFIGSNLLLHFAQAEPETEVIIVDVTVPTFLLPPNGQYIYADIRNLASLLMALDGVDEVYNLAGILGTSELLTTPSLAAEINIVGAANVFDACRRLGVKRVYNATKPFFDNLAENAYTATKHASELYARMYREQFDMEIATLCWMNAVGPYQHLYPVRKFVPTMILLALYGYDLEVYGDGSQMIDPIDTRDLSRFTIYACRNLGRLSQVIDLGSGKNVSCREAAELILAKTPAIFSKQPARKGSIVHVPMRVGEKPGVNLVANMSYWDDIGMKPEYSFEESIEAVTNYIVGLPEYTRVNALHYYKLNKQSRK